MEEMEDELREKILKMVSSYGFFMDSPNMEKVVAMGPQAVEPLIFALGKPDKLAYYNYKSVITALGKIKDERAVEPLVKFLKDKDWRIRVTTACALGEIGSPKATGALIEALADDYSAVRRQAAVALGKIGEPAAGAFLEAFYNSKLAHPSVLALADAGCLKFEHLVKALESPDLHFRGIVAEVFRVRGELLPALKKIDEPAAAAILEAFYENKLTSATALELADAGFLKFEHLLEALKSPYPQVRWVAATAFGLARELRAVEPLIDALNDSVRDAAVLALQRLRDRRAVGPLLGIVQNEKGDVRDNVVDALGGIGAPAVGPVHDKVREKGLGYEVANRIIRKIRRGMRAGKVVEKGMVVSSPRPEEISRTVMRVR